MLDRDIVTRMLDSRGASRMYDSDGQQCEAIAASLRTRAARLRHQTARDRRLSASRGDGPNGGSLVGPVRDGSGRIRRKRSSATAVTAGPAAPRCRSQPRRLHPAPPPQPPQPRRWRRGACTAGSLTAATRILYSSRKTDVWLQ